MTKTPAAVQRMALVKPSSWSEEDRTFEIVVSSERDVGDGVILVHDAGAFLFPERPVPATIDHSRQSKDVWGVIEEMRFERVDGVNALIGRGRVDGTEDAMAVAVPRLRNGSARFSVGALVHRWQESTDRSELYQATEWEVGEVSLVVVGMDSASIMRSPEQSTEPDHPMPEDKTLAGADPAAKEVVERNALAAEQTQDPTPEPARVAAVEVDRSAADLRRERDILRAAMNAGIAADKADELVRSGNPYQTCVEEIFGMIRDGMSKSPAGGITPVVTRDAGDTLMRSIGAGIEARIRPGALRGEDADLARQFRGYTLLEMTRQYLESRGVNTSGMGKTDLVARGFHSTSDFPLLFSNLAGKTLDAAYQEEPHTWRPIARQRNLPDFKLASDLVVAGDLTPEPLLEGGEYKAGTLKEAQHQWKLATYARKISLTRQAIINDDLSAMERVPEMLGRGFRRLESNIIWGLITGNAITSVDGVALFNAAHNNMGGSTGLTISTAGFNTARKAMRKQTDIAGNPINLQPSYLFAPTGLEATALQFLFPTGFAPAARTGDAGPAVQAQTAGVQLIVEPRLDGADDVWYLAASPGAVEGLVYGYLAGEEGPTVTTAEKRDPDGVELLARFDFGAAVKDFRGFYRSKNV
jgi:hypothetical protein